MSPRIPPVRICSTDTSLLWTRSPSSMLNAGTSPVLAVPSPLAYAERELSAVRHSLGLCVATYIHGSNFVLYYYLRRTLQVAHRPAGPFVGLRIVFMEYVDHPPPCCI